MGDTEDLYCDDELHPSLENDPNMRLYTENINTGHGDGRGIFDIGDDGKNLGNCEKVKQFILFRVDPIAGDPQHWPAILTQLQ